MKKILIALILVAIVFSVCSCSKTKKDASAKTEASSTVKAVEPVPMLPDDEIDTNKTKDSKESKNDNKTDNQSNSKKNSEKGESTTKQTTTQKVEVNTPSSKYETPIIPID